MRYFFLLLLITFLCTCARAQLEITTTLGLVADQCTGSAPDPDKECTSLTKGNEVLTYQAGKDGELLFVYLLSNNSGKIIRKVQVSDSRFGNFFPEQKVNIPNGATVPLNVIYDTLKEPETINGLVTLKVQYANGTTEEVRGTYKLEALAPRVETHGKTEALSELPEAIISNSVQLTAYPNPATDRLSLKGFAGGTVSVVDMQGRTVLHANLPEFGSLNVSDLPAGIYLLRTPAKSIRWMKQ